MRVILMRGLPCSGKSTYVESIVPGVFPEAVVCSADHIHIGDDKVFRFDPNKVQEGHNRCWRKFFAYMKQREQLIVIDNSLIALDELGAYWLPARASGYEVEVVTVRTPLKVILERNAAREGDKKVNPAFIERLDERMRIMNALIPSYWNHRFVDPE